MYIHSYRLNTDHSESLDNSMNIQYRFNWINCALNSAVIV